MVQDTNETLDTRQKRVFIKMVLIVCAIAVMAIIQYSYPSPEMTLRSILVTLVLAIFGFRWIIKNEIVQ